MVLQSESITCMKEVRMCKIKRLSVMRRNERTATI